jgi:hypothetical protein
MTRLAATLPSGQTVLLTEDPSPDLRWTMLRIARSKSTSPRRGEAK